MARHDFVLVPSSKMKLAIVKVLKKEGFISDYEVLKDKSHKAIKISLRYGENNQPVVTGLERVSKPGLKVYVQRGEIPRVYGGMGIAIVSTPKGIMTGHQAWRQGLGGELLCYVW
jgi:small subunit ribosomal protein S8